jgi:hypothetical protein
MSALVRILAIMLLAVFSGSTITHAENVTHMSVAMSPAAMSAGDMGDCDGCPPSEDGSASSCKLACLMPFAAVPATTSFGLAPVTADAAIFLPDELTGRIGPPDPSPPRSNV